MRDGIPAGIENLIFLGVRLCGIAFVHHGVLVARHLMVRRMALLISRYGPPKFLKRVIYR